MTQKKQIWKCEICGNVIEILHKGTDSLVCCGKPMTLIQEKIQDEGKEKHIPIIEKNGQGVIVRIGSVPHPMEEEHYIEWIEISTEKGSSKKFLSPGQKPEALFPVRVSIEKIKARAYCNVHGLWKSE